MVEWAGAAQLYGFTVVAGEPVEARAFTRRGAEKVKARLEAERLAQSGSAGKWQVRRG